MILYGDRHAHVMNARGSYHNASDAGVASSFVGAGR
jgi:hypothetical protein